MLLALYEYNTNSSFECIFLACIHYGANETGYTLLYIYMGALGVWS